MGVAASPALSLRAALWGQGLLDPNISDGTYISRSLSLANKHTKPPGPPFQSPPAPSGTLAASVAPTLTASFPPEAAEGVVLCSPFPGTLLSPSPFCGKGQGSQVRKDSSVVMRKIGFCFFCCKLNPLRCLEGHLGWLVVGGASSDSQGSSGLSRASPRELPLCLPLLSP